MQLGFHPVAMVSKRVHETIHKHSTTQNKMTFLRFTLIKNTLVKRKFMSQKRTSL